MLNGFHGRSGGDNEAGRGEGKDGVRPEEGVEPGRDPVVERMKGENGIWKSARDIILIVPTSDVVIRLAQADTPSSTPASSLYPLLPPRLLTQLFSPSTCLEVSPPNIVHPLTSNPPSQSIIIITIIINKNNLLPLTLPPLLIPKTTFHALSLTKLDRI